MLRNHIKSAIRTLSKNKAFAGINLFGLSIGMACFILIIAYVSRENSYDKYHKNANRIYRIVENMRTDNQDFYQATTSPPMGPTFAREFPEVENYVRFSNWLFDTYIVRVDEKVFNEPDCYHADSTVFNIFSFKLLKGNPRKVLSEPYSMVLDGQTAIKYFGSKDPIGQTVELNNENYKVTGVMEEVPENSHFRFNMLISMTSFIKNKEWENNAWGYNAFYTYLLLTDNKTAPANLRMKIPAYIDKYISKFSNQYKTYYSDLPIQSLISIYTEIPLTWENGKRGSKTNIVILLGIAVLIILIACLNYVNLATAMVGRRLKEVGLRKTLGALRSQLFVQYLAESAILSVLALFLAALFAILARPIINSLLGQSISLSYDGGSIGFWSPSFAGALLIGLLSGIYPALSLSGLEPIQLYKSQTHSISGNKWLRRGFVSVQFFISMSLIACSLVVLNQLDFVRSVDLGFKKDRTVIVEFPENKSSSGYAAFKNIFQETSGVTSVTGSSSVPGDPIDNAYCLFEKNVGSFSETSINVLTADRDFLSAYGIETIAGKSFETFHSDSGNHFMINKAAASHFGWVPAEQALGRTVDLQGKKGTIIGVTRDFHYKSLHTKVEPLLMFGSTENIQKMSIKLSPTGDISSLLATFHRKWRSITDLPFSYKFLDESVELDYKNDIQSGNFVLIFSVLAILIACLGMIGLVSFSVEQRSKEFSIRRLLGLSDIGISVVIAGELLIPIGISFVCATLLTYRAMNIWLTNFAVKETVGVIPMVVAVAAVLILSFCVIAVFAFRVSRTNPIENLQKS